MGNAICSVGLTRRFGKVNAVENLDLAVRSGAITAFLGPNGAGKTTTIRMLLGLVAPHSGTCEVLGFPPGHPQALAQIGAMVESPSLYDHLTGAENLEITRLMRNESRSEADRVLSLVGLAQDANRPVRGYSLGMRQRLGIALALMGKPKLLVLDEPTNGLDPMGIHEIRDLIRRLPLETGATIFLSSHLLAEIEQVAEDLVVIHQGRLRFQGPMAALGSVGPAEITVRVDDPVRATECLSAQGFLVRIEGERLWIKGERSEAPLIVSGLVGAGISVFELVPHRVNLEDRFLALLEGE